MYHHLGAGDPLDEAAKLREAVTKAVTTKTPSLTVGLDELAALDAGVLNGLIAGLRRLRNVGGAMQVHVTRPDLLRALDITGLDRVFKVVATAPEEEPPRPARRRRVKGARKLAGGIAAVVAAIAVVAGSTLAAFAESDSVAFQTQTPQQIVQQVVSRNPALTSFEAHVDVRLHTGVPFLNPALEGTTYFKRPDNYEVVFTKVPSYAKGLEQLYTDIGDPSEWNKKFTITLAGDEQFQNHRDIVLRLVQRVRGMIDHENVLIDPQDWTIVKFTYYYYNGGTISLEQSYRQEDGFTVLSDQRAVISLPHIPRAIGTAHYSAYRMNVAIDDSVFTMKQTKELGTK